MATEALLPDTVIDNSDVKPSTEPTNDNEQNTTANEVRKETENFDTQPGPSHAPDRNETQSNLDNEAKNTVQFEWSEPAVETDDAKLATDFSCDRLGGDKFVLLNPYSEYNKDEKLRNGFFTQMESVLKLQAGQCAFYKSYFEQQSNEAMRQKFEAYEKCTIKYIDLLNQSYLKKEMLPAHKWEVVNFNCLPVNADVKDKEIQLIVKSSNLGVSNTADVYIVAEFEFPLPKDEPIGTSFSRWLHHVRIEPKLICCTNNDSRQLDIVKAIDVLPFDKPESKYTGYTRALSFFVDKGKSRTLKRKFKPVKLTFYEKKHMRKDRKIGSVQIKIDQVNDVSTSVVRAYLMEGRRELEAVADVRIRVREPLVDKSIRAHEEKMLHLT